MFNNRENESIIVDNKEVWLSRSCAVSMMLICRKDNKTYILMGKRGVNMTHPGKWCMPCGYMDWDENGYDAARRETYEETGILLPEGNTQPWYVDTEPRNFLQNITLHYDTQIPEIIEPTNKNCGEQEVSELKWFELNELIEMEDNMFAFSHKDLIKKRVKNYTPIFGN